MYKLEAIPGPGGLSPEVADSVAVLKILDMVKTCFSVVTALFSVYKEFVLPQFC